MVRFILNVTLLVTMLHAPGAAAEPLRRRYPLIAELGQALIAPPLAKKDLGEPCAGVSYPNPYSPLPPPLAARHRRMTITRTNARVELRDAFLLDLPRTVTWQLEAPIEPRLEFGYRLFPCGGRGPQTLRVITEDASGRDVQTVTLTDKKSADLGWRDVALDLRVLPGQPFRLTLEFGPNAKSGKLMLALAEPAVTGRESDVTTDADTNVLWIVIDAVRSDALGPGRNFVIPTPNLDAVFAAGTSFRRAYALGNQTRTSTTAMIASVHPSIGGFHSHSWAFAKGHLETFYASRPPLVTALLEAAGWRVAHLGHNFFLWGSDPVGIDAGFPRIIDYRAIPEDAVYASDDASQWFADHRDERWFMMLNYTAPHTPYEAPEEFDKLARTMPGPERFGDYAQLPRSYLGELMWVDHNLQRVFAALEQHGLAERTLIIVTADHGEVMFPWHDCRGEGGERCGFNHSWTVYDDELNVPLVLTLPGRIPARVVEAPTSHADVAPTILDLLGQPPAGGMAGDSLLPVLLGGPSSSRPVYADGRKAAALRSGDWKLIVHSPNDVVTPRSRRVPEDGDEDPKHELFDLATDPTEKTNVVRAHPEVLERLLGELTAARNDLFSRFTTRAVTPAAVADARPTDLTRADNRLMVVAAKDPVALSGTLRAPGGTLACGPPSVGVTCRAQDGALDVSLHPPAAGRAILEFTSEPWSAPLSFDLTFGGKPLPTDRLRLGPWGLALLSRGATLDSAERLRLAVKSQVAVQPLPQPNEAAAYFWRSGPEPSDSARVAAPGTHGVVPPGFVAPEDAVTNPDADKALGAEVRKVLKDLGYSN